MRTIKTLKSLMTLVDSTSDTLYIRYSRGPQVDAKSEYRSRNHVTGQHEAGLSVERMTPPEWWTGSRDEYVIMQVCSYCYLLMQGDKGTRAWVMTASEIARGSDNEVLVEDVTPLAWIDTTLIDELVRYNVAVLDAEDGWRRLSLVERREREQAGNDIAATRRQLRREMLAA